MIGWNRGWVHHQACEQSPHNASIPLSCACLCPKNVNSFLWRSPELVRRPTNGSVTGSEGVQSYTPNRFVRAWMNAESANEAVLSPGRQEVVCLAVPSPLFICCLPKRASSALTSFDLIAESSFSCRAPLILTPSFEFLFIALNRLHSFSRSSRLPLLSTLSSIE